MKEFEPFEIEHSGREAEVQLLYCPLLKADCIGERCQWWVRDWNEDKQQFQYNCAVSLIAIGANDESLIRSRQRRG